jgi:hypothetical protein
MGICTLSLTVGRGNEGCEQESASSHATGATMNGHKAVHHQSPVDTGGHKPCKASTLACCQAMTACGLSATLRRTLSTDESRPDQVALNRTTFETPLKRIVAPEPPPPKA